MEFKTGIYQHYKGMKYLALGITRHSETLEELVLYISLYDNPDEKMWVRPLKMFMEEVEVNGVRQPRFKFLSAS
jgi:hypothetical protein